MAPRVERLHVPGLSEAIAARGVPLAVATRSRGLLFVSGLPPFDGATGRLVNETLEAQLRQCVANLRQVLQVAGCSSDDLLMVTLYVTNAGYFDRLNRLYREEFGSLLPARTCLCIGAWPFEADIEIEAIAACAVTTPTPTTLEGAPS